jgi:G3E family GTPase
VPVLQTIVTDDELRGVYRLQDVVTVVDALHGWAQLDRQDESLKQAAVADALLISKVDMASPEAVNALRARLERLNPAAEIHEVAHGVIDPELLLRGQPRETAAADAVERWLCEARHAHAEGGHRDNGIHAFSLSRDEPIGRAGLALWLDMLAGLRGANLLRVKGVLNVEGEPCVVHAVQSVVHEPVTLSAWPSDDRRSRVVVIARDMTRDEVEHTFTAFDYAPRPQSRVIDPAAYAQFVAAMKGFQR